MKELDDFVEMLGKPNRYSAIIIFLICLILYPMCFNHMIMAIYGAIPPHRCNIPDGFDLNQSIPINEQGAFDKCHVYVNYSKDTGLTEPCPNGWHFELLEGESTIVSEARAVAAMVSDYIEEVTTITPYILTGGIGLYHFDEVLIQYFKLYLQWELVCDKLYLGPLASSIYFIGTMIGGVCLGTLSERLGRKKVMLAAIYIHIILGIMVYFTYNYILFLILRGLIGICITAAINSLVLAVEWLRRGPGRVRVNCLMCIIWSIGVAYLGGIAYGVKEWRKIQLIISLPCLLTIGYIWCIPESLRWLLTNGQFEEAERCLIRAAKFNGVTLPPDPLGIEEDKKNPIGVVTQTQGHATIIDLVRYPVVRKRVLIMAYCWFSTSFIYFALSLSASSVAGNKYVNFVVSGLVELPLVIAGLFAHRIGRRPLLITYTTMSGICCILSGAIPYTSASGLDLTPAASTFAWLGKLFNMGMWSIIIMYSSELFPTEIRNMGMLFCDASCRIGSTFAPQLALLVQYGYRWIPSTILGGSALIMAGLILLLPETRDAPLPDTIDEVENPYKVNSAGVNSTGITESDGSQVTLYRGGTDAVQMTRK